MLPQCCPNVVPLLSHCCPTAGRAPRVGASEASFDTTTVALLSHSCPTAAPMLSHCCMKSKARFPFTYRTGSLLHEGIRYLKWVQNCDTFLNLCGSLFGPFWRPAPPCATNFLGHFFEPQRPTAAHSGPQRPIAAHSGPQQPTAAHSGPRRPTE